METLNNYTKWSNLINLIEEQTGIYGYETGICVEEHYGLALNRRLPYSISEYEFNFMKKFIQKHNLKYGYELATGIGISTISIGFALGKNGGELVTIDSYLEEYGGHIPINNNDLSLSDDGLNRNQKIFKDLKLNNIFCYKSSSPDCYTILDKHFKKLDFVFLDCPKDPDDFIRDTSILKNRMSEKFAIFVHDSHCFPNEFLALSKEIFGIEAELIYDFETPDGTIKQTYPLALITNLEKE